MRFVNEYEKGLKGYKMLVTILTSSLLRQWKDPASPLLPEKIPDTIKNINVSNLNLCGESCHLQYNSRFWVNMVYWIYAFNFPPSSKPIKTMIKKKELTHNLQEREDESR